MNIKHALVPLVAAGGLTAALFGGGAVSTAFTSDASGTVQASGATVDLTTTLGTVAISGLVPGGSVTSTPFTLENNSNTGHEALYLTDVAFNPTTPGSNNVEPSDSDITVSVAAENVDTGGKYVTILQPTPLASLVGANTLVSNNPPEGLSQNIEVTFALAQDAGNNWNGAAANVPFTLHLQDTSGTDGNGYATGVDN